MSNPRIIPAEAFVSLLCTYVSSITKRAGLKTEWDGLREVFKKDGRPIFYLQFRFGVDGEPNTLTFHILDEAAAGFAETYFRDSFKGLYTLRVAEVPLPRDIPESLGQAGFWVTEFVYPLSLYLEKRDS